MAITPLSLTLICLCVVLAAIAIFEAVYIHRRCDFGRKLQRELNQMRDLSNVNHWSDL